MKLITYTAISITGLALASCNTASSLGNAAGGALQSTGNAVGSATQNTVQAGKNVTSAVGNDVANAGRVITGN